MEIRTARTLAASYLAANGRADQADIILRGGGDDFPEVQLAVQLWRMAGGELRRYRQALLAYADGAFWDGDCPEASLAFHDRGDVARGALAGKELFQLHRD